MSPASAGGAGACWQLGPEPVAPLSDTLVRDEDTAFGKDQLEVAQARAKDVVQPNGMADDLGWVGYPG